MANANGQLLGHAPGAIHVGIEATQGEAVEALRYLRNTHEIASFDPGGSGLRWVYCNILGPDATPNLDEAWAFDETTAWFKVGRHTTGQPLPNHMLVVPEDEGIREGMHWRNGD